MQPAIHNAPTRIEKYDVKEEIGHGGMATVYRAEDTRLGRDVALKILHPHLRGTEQARARFHREAQSVAKLKHPNILEIYDYSGLDSELSYIATELLTGPTLKKLVDDAGRIPPEVAVAICLRLGEALSAAHALGIVHRDVKPENVLLHEDRTVKLADFGIADMVDAHSVTATGQILGSPGHMAPEQIEGKDADARADIFSLGTVLYVLLTGELPFSGRNVHAILHRVLEGQYTDPERLCPQMGKSLRRILVKAMAREANDRYVSAREFCAALEEWLSRHQIDEPSGVFAEFLRVRRDANARQAFETKWKDHAFENSLRLGRKAVEVRDVEAALDHVGRALSIRPDAREAKDLLQRLGKRRRQNRAVLAGASTLAIATLAMIVWNAKPSISERPPETVAPIASRQPRTPPVTPTPTPTPRTSLDSIRPAVFGMTKLVRPRPHAATPRAVLFDFDPVNVSISVDDSPPRPFGASFDRMNLTPGTHRFSVTSNVECCADANFTVDVPEGSEPFRVRRTLASRPALLIVRSNVAGDVRVADRASGRTRTPVEVPMGTDRTLRTPIEVRAEGYATASSEVELHAGDVTTINVALERETLRNVAETPPT